MKPFLILKSFLALAILILVIFSCKKIPHYMSIGEIIGVDNATCQCCGGIEISIYNFQNPNGNAYFLAGSLPSNFTTSNNAKFPIPVTLDWKIDSTGCFGNYIIVTKIARR